METMARKLSALGKGAPDVESKLDEFISRANNDLLDVSAFDANNREHQLQREVDELKDKLAIAEARAHGSKGWGKAAIAFVVGCGAMFAITTLMPREQAAPREEPKAAVAPAPAPAPAPPAQVTPIEPPAQQAAAPAPAPEPAAAPAPAPETVAAAPAPAPASTPKPTKHARHAATPSSSPAKTPDSTPPAHDEKPAETKQAGSDTLYNPF